MDRFVLVAQFYSMDVRLTARVESVRLACEACHGQWDVARSGAAVEVRPARMEAKEPLPAKERDAEPLDSDLRGLYKRERMPRR